MSNKIDAVAKAGGTTPDGRAFARLEYYMVDNPKQTQPRKIPGFIVGNSAEEAFNKAKSLADELDGLNLSELPAAYRQMYADKRMLRVLE